MWPLERPDRRERFFGRTELKLEESSVLYRPARPLPHWNVDTQTIVILDFGSQYTQLIARRIREQNVFSVVLPCTAPLAEIEAYKPIGLILSGGPSSVYDADAPDADPRLLEMEVPTLGICYGLHFIVHHLGGKVRTAPKREYGHAEVALEDSSTPLFAGLPPAIQVWMSHGDEALELPPGFRRTAVTSNALAAIANEERRIWAVQFHPEVHHTPLGPQLIKNFVFGICGASGRLDAGALYRDHGCGDSRKSGQRARDLRTFGRRGFVGCGGAGAQGDRQPADVHFCEQRRPAQERIPKRAEESARQAGAEYCCRGCERAIPDTAGRSDRSGDEAQADWRGVYRGL